MALLPYPRPSSCRLVGRNMNLELLDPFAKTVPDHVDSVLSYGVEDATVCCFDKRGAYLAVGYATGIVVIWDFVTRGIGRVIEAHARAITALSWSRGGRRLLSASHDQRLHFWALEPPRPELIRVICLDSPIMSALMLPGKYPRALALTADGVPRLVDIKENVTKAICFTDRTVVLPPSAASVTGSPSPAKKARTSSWTDQHGLKPLAPKPSGASTMPAVLCLALDRRAPRVCLGTSDGQVLSVGTSDGEVSRSMPVAGCSKVKQLDLSRDGKWMLVNAGEKVIRMLERESTTGRSVRDFQDVVNRTRWQCCRFTGDSEYIAGGSRAEAACSIYIWTVEGHLVTRLEGPNLGLLHLMRHPVRPFLAAALTNGKVQLWGTTPTANWTAFAADFEELEESVEYVEKEDEFDVVVDFADPEGHKRKAEKEQEEEEVVVSIQAIDAVDAWSSDSEEEDRGRELFYLSTEPGAAAREGWYDLEVQTSKKGLSSERGDGCWDDKEEWTSVRAGGASGASSGGVGEAEENGERSGAVKKGSSRKKRHGSRREFGKKSRSHSGKSQSEADKAKAGDGDGVGGGGGAGGEGGGGGRGGAAGTSSAEDNNGTGNGTSSQPRRPAPNAPPAANASPSIRQDDAGASNTTIDGVEVALPHSGSSEESGGRGEGRAGTEVGNG